jgi:uncharacterized protein YuzE
MQVAVDIDKKGAINGVQSEDERSSVKISVSAEIGNRLNPEFDMDKLLEKLRRDPSKPIKV